MAGKETVSNFYNPSTSRTARTQHKCTYCCEDINPGDVYMYQKGVHEGRWFESKMHPECFDDMCETGDGEYTPYSNERPKAAA